jgi:hypothetical protein
MDGRTGFPKPRADSKSPTRAQACSLNSGFNLSGDYRKGEKRLPAFRPLDENNGNGATWWTRQRPSGSCLLPGSVHMRWVFRVMLIGWPKASMTGFSASQRSVRSNGSRGTAGQALADALERGVCDQQCISWHNFVANQIMSSAPQRSSAGGRGGRGRSGDLGSAVVRGFRSSARRTVSWSCQACVMPRRALTIGVPQRDRNLCLAAVRSTWPTAPSDGTLVGLASVCLRVRDYIAGSNPIPTGARSLFRPSVDTFTRKSSCIGMREPPACRPSPVADGGVPVLVSAEVRATKAAR